MSVFELHPRLQADCIRLGRLSSCHVLLMNNADVPWFILVPEPASGIDVEELIDLPVPEQQQVLKDVNLVSAYVKHCPEVTKLNTAALGNIVPQLHIHIVGRNPNDYCWPSLVWASEPGRGYSSAALDRMQAQFCTAMSDELKPYDD
ncbi:MAG: HIT domain-containing protein [Gammaproteobacteria bacterium]|nr:HIT domain-containing protein [Gammaproteobacteria bacterium]